MSTADSGVVCANIGPAERRKRNLAGVIGTVLSLLTLGALIETHAGWPVRLLISLPAFMAAIGFAQARAQTCVAFAAKNVQVLGDGPAVQVADEKVRAQLNRQARAVYRQTAVATAVAVVVTLLLP